jgi:uncharacterized protein involved in outer membrane biogenesis
MKKLLLAVAVLGLVVLLVVGFVAARFLRSLDTPEFQKTLVDRTSEALGAKLSVQKLELSVLEGLRLEGVTIANPPPFRGELLSADAFVLRYRLRPLLRGRMEIQQLSLHQPHLRLVSDAAGNSNVATLVAHATKRAQPSRPRSGAARALPFTLVLSRLAVEDARITATDHTGATLFEAEDADFTSGFEVDAAGARGTGDATVKTVRLKNGTLVSDISGKLTTAGREARLSPLRGEIAGGTLNGDVRLRFGDAPGYSARIDVEGAQLERFLEQAKSPRSFSGKLGLKASFEGSAGLPQLVGRGQGQVTDCKVEREALLAALAATLRLPDLAKPDFEDCRVEFSLARAVITNQVVNLKGPAVHLTGRGTTSLETQALDYEMNLALAAALLERIPVREIRAGFKDRGDGFAAIDFNVTGTSSAPQLDLLSRIGRAAAKEAAKGGAQKLLDEARKRLKIR